MKASKRRRSERVRAAHRLMLIVERSGNASPLKEIVTSVEISRHGALIRGRQPLSPERPGTLIHLSSCRQAPCRIVYQIPSSAQPGFFDTGIEVVETNDFWGRTFADYQGPVDHSDVVTEPSRLTPLELLRQLETACALPQGEKRLEILWCGLVQQLEERGILTRGELVATLRRLANQNQPRA